MPIHKEGMSRNRNGESKWTGTVNNNEDDAKRAHPL